MKSMNMPGFSADKSLYKSRSYRTRSSGFPLALSSSLMPAITNFSFGIGAGAKSRKLGSGLVCRECTEGICLEDLPCKPPRPGCRREECDEECKNVPCIA